MSDKKVTVAAAVKPLLGKWKIRDLDPRVSDEDAADFIELKRGRYGTLQTCGFDTGVDWRPDSDYKEGDLIHFTAGPPDENNYDDDFNEETSGRGWFRTQHEDPDSEPILVGHLIFHHGDETDFKARKVEIPQSKRKRKKRTKTKTTNKKKKRVR